MTATQLIDRLKAMPPNSEVLMKTWVEDASGAYRLVCLSIEIVDGSSDKTYLSEFYDASVLRKKEAA